MMMTYLERTEKPEKSIPVVNSPQKIPASETGISVNSHAAWSHQQLTTIADQSSGISQLQAYSDLANSGKKVTQLKNVQQWADNAVIQRVKWSTGKLDGKETNVNWKTQKLDDVEVGVEMEATLLGPDHKQGTPPQSGAQKKLMNKLPTDPKFDNQNKYVRGHLLNDNLGGEGKPYNLFPITANANKEHERVIESKVKNWVNDEKQWVYYHVKVTDVAVNLSLGYINATFDCEASVLDSDNEPINTIKANIVSEHGTANKTDAKDAAGNGLLDTVGDEAKDSVPLLSLTHKLYDKLDKDTYNELVFLFANKKAAKILKATLLEIEGIGKGTIETLRTMEEDGEEVKKNKAALKRVINKIGHAGLLDVISDTYDKIH
ncbi:MAG TPA: DNA/RNA non-specific endonuclease [Fluviicola sp.]|nr:DNA/RNA non-specific endonuclease [Fluviicola sp.]